MINVKQLRHVRVAQVGNGGNYGENRAVGQPEDDCAYHKANKTGDKIIYVALAATGGAGARSEAGSGHADAENQPAQQVAQDVRGRGAGERNQPQVF